MRIDQIDAESFLGWLLANVVHEARGDRYDRLPVGPKGRFWLGRLAPQDLVLNSQLGDRAERLDPCATGFRVRPTTVDGRTIRCKVQMAAWREIPGHGTSPDEDKWEKTDVIHVKIDLQTPCVVGEISRAGRKPISEMLSAVSANGLSAEIQAELEIGQLGPELVITVVNTSPEKIDGLDTNLYEVQLSADLGPTLPFQLDRLPDSFRYDRMVPAYGINGGVTQTGTSFATVDYSHSDRYRPEYFDNSSTPEPPAMTFRELAKAPLDELSALLASLEGWTEANWHSDVLAARSIKEEWSDEMTHHANEEAERARDECKRMRNGLELLNEDPDLLRAFSLANEAFDTAVTIEYDSWRPFQVGYVLANVGSLSLSQYEKERKYLDTLWFATGGGKTETYLLFTLMSAFVDRLRGKFHGISSWARFPLRMLSLQQTQRFADVLAAAELIRQREGIDGDTFALGFFVGAAGSPNRIVRQQGAQAYGITDADMDDPDHRARFQILIHCPFCATPNPVMRFDRSLWSLQHHCVNSDCPWGQRPLPFYIVDEEIYRWLPTVVLGTLDKAASISMQAAMRGFYGPPIGQCSIPGHGFTYAPRGAKPHGCLFPRCRARPIDLTQERSLFAPSLRMQDELHLLRDSLGAIDAHYEALLDDLQSYWGMPPKIIASSATLAGHADQARSLYRREGRMFPVPGPTSNRSFWAQESARLARRFVGFAPRGVTLEYANDQLNTTVQRAVRKALDCPAEAGAEAGVPEEAIESLIAAYGISVTYGSTLKDVEAAARSFESQIPIDDLNSQTLTGRTSLDDVRTIIERVKEPEQNFEDRIHVIAASSMLSHGVDLDRLNIMVMLGLPLATAEFIQTTARVGRAYPGLVFVMHKIGRERDAAVFRTFPSFIQHMDRLVDPVPITARSRRVLELTFSGLEMARVYGTHEPLAIEQGLGQLTTPQRLREALTRLGVDRGGEARALADALDYLGPLTSRLREDIMEYMDEFFCDLYDPATNARWPSQLFRKEPMLSLRDVDKQIPVYSRGRE